MFNLTSLLKTCNHPQIPNMRDDEEALLYPDGGTMGTLILGLAGSGKTSFTAHKLINRAIMDPNVPIFVLDWSGSITDTFLEIVASQPEEIKQKLLKRIVYDELGNKEWVVPMPEFSPRYGSTYEEQVQRVAKNLQKLSSQLGDKSSAPILAGASLGEVATQFMRLTTSVRNEYDESWQITETKRLIVDWDETKKIVTKYGDQVPEAAWYITREFLNKDVRPQERDLRTYFLRAMLGLIEPREVKARLGYHRPGWTPREAIRKGLIVLVTGKGMINQAPAQHYLFTQIYSLIMEQINERTPADPDDHPVVLVLDEVYALIQIPGMAEEVGMISPLYRSRKLELYVIIQALWQLEEGLREKIWSLGNVVCFGVHDFNEAVEVSQQLFRYEPQMAKMPARTQNQNPTAEPDHGQYTLFANWLQNLKRRECVMRRYFKESRKDEFIRHIRQTPQLPPRPARIVVEELRDKLLKERAVMVRDALEVISQRKVVGESRPQV